MVTAEVGRKRKRAGISFKGKKGGKQRTEREEAKGEKEQGSKK